MRRILLVVVAIALAGACLAQSDYTLLTERRILPYYQTAAQYLQATGLAAPPFDQTKPVKRWSNCGGAAGPDEVWTYQALATDPKTGGVLKDSNGRPYLKAKGLMAEAACAVNIPPDTSKPGSPNPTQLPEIQAPVAALAEGEILVFLEELQHLNPLEPDPPVVTTPAAITRAQANAAVAWTAADRARDVETARLVRAIADSLKVK